MIKGQCSDHNSKPHLSRISAKRESPILSKHEDEGTYQYCALLRPLPPSPHACQKDLFSSPALRQGPFLGVGTGAAVVQPLVILLHLTSSHPLQYVSCSTTHTHSPTHTHTPTPHTIFRRGPESRRITTLNAGVAEQESIRRYSTMCHSHHLRSAPS
jgi:hypothetical protein